MENNIKIIVCEPNKEAYESYIEPTIEAIQEIVGDFLESHRLSKDGVFIFMNEEGQSNMDWDRDNNLEENRYFKGRMIYGTFIICRESEKRVGEFNNLYSRDVDRFLAKFRFPDTLTFSRNGYTVDRYDCEFNTTF